MRYLIILVSFAACGRGPVVPRISTTCTDCPSAWHEQQGLVVHEWGTFTSVMASDGTLLPGLHHEEEDLPSFVADRLSASVHSGNFYPNEKMETPVTYFYAPSAMQVSARV